jgi:hypothetical protein
MSSRRTYSEPNTQLAQKYSQMLSEAGISDRQEAIAYLDKRFPKWRTYLTIFANPNEPSEFLLVGRAL